MPRLPVAARLRVSAVLNTNAEIKLSALGAEFKRSMKPIINIAAVLSLGLLLSTLAVSAKTVEQVYIDTYNGRTDIPVPISVIAPEATLGATNQPATVELVFIVDEKGTPRQIKVQSTTDESLVEPVKEAVAQWKFVPAKRNGEAVSSRVRLPVRIVAAD